MGTIKNTLCVALTGGIGSGKTTVSDLFFEFGIPVIDADVIAHQLTEKKAKGYEKIADHFDQYILFQDGNIDRKKLRKIVFENPDEKKWLENLLHPMIREKMREEIKKVETPYCVCVIPLLAESKPFDFIDRVLVIDAPIEVRIKRIQSRDQSSVELIQKMIASQAEREKRLSIADDVINNDGDFDALRKKVGKMHQHYLKLST